MKTFCLEIKRSKAIVLLVVVCSFHVFKNLHLKSVPFPVLALKTSTYFYWILN